MADMGIASCAQHLSPSLGQAVVNLFTHIFFGNRRPRAGPSRVRIKLRLGAEQWQLAGDAFKYPLLVNVIEWTRVGRLSSLLPRHLVLLRRENSFPLCICLDHF